MEAIYCVPMRLASTSIVIPRVPNKLTFMMFLDLFPHEFWEMWDTFMFKFVYRHFGGGAEGFQNVVRNGKGKSLSN
jgi:hypothetical protein